MYTKPNRIRNLRLLVAIVAVVAVGLGVQTGLAQSDGSRASQAETEATNLASTHSTDSNENNQPATDNPGEPVADNDPYLLRTKPAVAEGIGVDGKEGEMLVMDIAFNDEQNRRVTIGDYFDGKRPVMLSFNYSNCPKLCSVQLENMTLTLREVDEKFGLKVGDDFQMVSITIDPTEQTSRARKTKAKYTELYNRPGTEDGWHFLTGDDEEIETIAAICGFRYKYVPEQKLYSHPPVFILISPEGKIVRYIHGLDYDSQTIKLALVESAEGKIGSPINILSYGIGCFLFDPSTGKYTFQAMAVMRIGGAITAGLLFFTLAPYWFYRRGRTGKTDKPEKPGVPLVNPNGGTT